MKRLQRGLYGLAVRMHPASFREEFGREMLLDFDDALPARGFWTLYADALRSLALQWTVRRLVVETEHRQLGPACLLNGQYSMIDAGGLGALAFGRGVLASVALIGVCVFSWPVQRSALPARTDGGEEPYFATSARGGSSAGAEDSTGEGVRSGARVEGRTVVTAEPSDRAANRVSEGRRGASGMCGWGACSGAGMAVVPVAEDQFRKFDVASVKENRSAMGVGEASMNFPLNREGYARTGGVLRVTNFPLSGYLMFAYKLTVPQSVALAKQLPDWARTARYDIEGRVEGEPDKDDMRTMMRALLEERFGLTVHEEVREIPVLEMGLVKAGKLGPNLSVSEGNPGCAGEAVPAGFFSPCGAIGFMPGVPTRAAGREVSMAAFAENFSGAAGRMLVDKTGLTGKYSFTLEYLGEGQGGAEGEAAAPTFVGALKEQAGLKLVPGTGATVVSVLDRVAKPLGN